MNASISPETLYLEDIKVGDQWYSDEREITGQDVKQFAGLTGDHTNLHSAEAESSPFGEPVAHGLLGLSVLAGLSSNNPNAATLAFVAITDWQFDSPIFFGDRVKVLTEVADIQPHGRRAGRVLWHRKLLNQNGKVVQQGKFITLVARRARVRKPGHRPSEHSDQVSVQG